MKLRRGWKVTLKKSGRPLYYENGELPKKEIKILRNEGNKVERLIIFSN